ncbi:MAG: TetR family transcriptional regulator [Actinobacteria bacterium]|uniref:Unannotated protein n=1 Tax=freshwater metagenome TaxID=449393 RepID=A0A6J6NS38_9ZZZZ|nr:TetR family transcriptional regulator [Actinomycetota bacterium]
MSPRPTRPAGGSQARGDRTRALIVEEMVRCVLEEGFAAASANRVADRAGVTWGVVQYHFGNRTGILAAVIEAGFASLTAEMASITVSAGPSRERVGEVIDAGWAAFSSPLSRAAFEILVATRTDRAAELDDRLVDIARHTRRLGSMLTPGHPAVGEVIWSALRGMALTQMVVREQIDTARERAALTEVVTAFLEAQP